MAYKLVLRWADRREERPLAGRTVRLGRDPDNDIVIESPDRSVSRHHARLDFDGRSWRIVDTRSTNGVRVNGELITPGEAGARALADGDRFLLGALDVGLVREERGLLLTDESEDTGQTAQTSTRITRMQDLAGLIELPTGKGSSQGAE